MLFILFVTAPLLAGWLPSPKDRVVTASKIRVNFGLTCQPDGVRSLEYGSDGYEPYPLDPDDEGCIHW